MKKWQKYNVTDFLGSDYVFENNIFTGTVIPMWDSISKNNAINDFVVKYDLDLSNSYAYGDTNGDINMLKKSWKSNSNKSNKGTFISNIT